MKIPSSFSAAMLVSMLAWSLPAIAEPSKQECVSANESAQDLRQAGKLREAQVKLSVCVVASCPGPVREDCAQRLDEVVKATPSVVFDVKDSAGRELPGVRFSVDGGPAGSMPVIALALNPGQHVFRFEVAGKPGVEREVLLREGEKERRVSVFSFNGSAELNGPAPIPESRGPGGKPGVISAPKIEQPSLATTSPIAPEDQTDQNRGDRQRMAGWITGSAGVAAMGVGIGLALSAKASWQNAPGCKDTQCGDENGLKATNSARSMGVAATAVFIVGAVAATTGVVLWLTAERAQPASAAGSWWRVGLTSGGATAEGRF